MLTSEQIDQLADELHQSETTRTPVEHFSKRFPVMTIEDGYRISRAWVARQLAQGRQVIGHKIGLTSRAMQMSSQINEPDFGTLLDEMVYKDASDIASERFIDPMVEVELAFILKDRLEGEQVTIFDVLSATDYVVPAVEIIDARCHRIDPHTKRPRKVMDTISDNAANVGIILGGRPIKPMDIDLRWASALLYKNGVIEETGVAAGVLNHPANGIAWLSKKFAPHNVPLLPGQIILAGSFTRPVKVKAGDTIHVDYGPLGNISARFV